MARPKHLNTKGLFSVRLCSDSEYALVYKGIQIVRKSPSRHALYTARTEYSSWFERITLLQSIHTELEHNPHHHLRFHP